jgi:tetratricopeptide (TPR) repeat protein
VLFVTLALVLAAPLGAQKAPRTPKRPTLPAGKDPNSASDYYFYGVSVLGTDPEKAEAAFWWSQRLNPYLAEPIYGEYVASLLVLPTDLITDYELDAPGVDEKKDIRHTDSLLNAALERNPWVDRRLDNTLLEVWLYRATQGGVSLIDLKKDRPRFSAFVSYTYGEYEKSASQYADLIKKYPKSHRLAVWRARPLLALGKLDSAIASIQTSLALHREEDSATAMRPYESRAFTEYSLGVLHERAQRADSAQAAYERALLDNIQFAAAHWRLAHLRIAAGDTARAMQEFTDAVGIDSTDAVSLYELGSLALAAGHSDSAVTLLKKSIVYEPYFLQPHFLLGRVYEMSGFKEEAIAEYTNFVRLAPRSMPNEIAAARRWITALGGTPPP